MADDGNGLALVLSGGGARAAYQVGFLRCLARNFPDLNIPIITGVSAGAINAAFLANHTGTFAEAVEELSELWLKLSVDQVFCVDTWKLIRNVFRWGVRLVSGGFSNESSARSLLDSTPLRELLQRAFLPQGNVIGGIRKNLLEQIPEEQHDDRHVVYLFAMRPSEDLGELAGGFEPELPYMFRYLFRGLGTRETSSPDWLSMVMFDPNYLTHLVKLGENDADKQTGAIMELMNF
ncbi:MAG: patatin-like phospholipase family protein [Deltaproteobacteria bacterium]|nr:patatin-like phospholipase family protein [Deltaproteobacteria bacterium]